MTYPYRSADRGGEAMKGRPLLLHHVTAARESIYTKLSGLTCDPAAACANSLYSQFSQDPPPLLGHMAENQRPESYGDAFNPYSIDSDIWSGTLPWDHNTSGTGDWGTNECLTDDIRFDWNIGEYIIPASPHTRSMAHPGDQSPSQAVLHNPLSISTNCVNPATSTASASPSNVCDQSEQATEMDYQSNASDREGVSILQWKQMDRDSRNRLKKSYKPQSVKEGDEDDLKLRRDIWHSLYGKSTGAVMFKKQQVFSRVCNAEAMREKKCDAILVVVCSMDAKVEWSQYACFKCNNREASRKLRCKKRQHKADSDEDTGGRRVMIPKARHKADSEGTRGGEVIAMKARDTSTDFEVIRKVINAQRSLAAE